MISVLLFSVAASACAPVHDSVLRARDLAAVDARFAAAPPEEVIGYAPAPGSRRVFAEAEMTRFARRFAIEGVARPVCFAYAMKPLDRAGALAAIVQAIPGVEAEILDAPRFPVPDGHRMRRAVQAGMRIPANAIEPSIQAVGRGDEVRVEVAAGGARLQIDARAEGSAVLGGMVKLRNPKSGKVFEARVTGKGTASVITQAVTPEETK
jgi:flagella basal body P-ring formation protein FlgA